MHLHISAVEVHLSIDLVDKSIPPVDFIQKRGENRLVEPLATSHHQGKVLNPTN